MILALLIAALCTPLPTCSDIVAPLATTVVQSRSVNAAYALPSTLSFPAANTAGNAIFVAIRAGTRNGHVFTVTDTLGNIYTEIAHVNMSIDVETLSFFYVENALAGANTVTLSDAITPGATRWAIVELANLGAHVTDPLPFSFTEGYSVDAATPWPGAASDFVLTMIGTGNDTEFVPGPDGVMISREVKFFLEHSSSTATMNPSVEWGAMSVAFAGGMALPPCATPTPVVAWDQIPDADLAGYLLFYREPGGVLQLLVDLPCEWFDFSEPPDGITETQFCRGPDLGVPLQRYCPSCAPFMEYEFAVKAYDLSGFESLDYSNIVSVCFSPICTPPGPCS